MNPVLLFRALLLVALFGGSELAAAVFIVRGPYLQNGGPDHVTVCWRTNVRTNASVYYGTAPDALSKQASDPSQTSDHAVTLKGLTANTTYYYTVGLGTAGGVLAGPYSFRTAPRVGSEQPIRVWAIGDSGRPGAAAVRDSYEAFTDSTRTDVWLMLGDNAYEKGLDTEYQTAVFDMFPAQLRSTVLWPTIGNHDTNQSRSPTNVPYLDIFTLPTRGESGGKASGTERYYSFDYGNVHFICLDSMTSNNSPYEAMAKWLRADLASTAQKWIIAFWHHAPYSKAGHDSDTEADMIAMRKNIVPILEDGGVDLVLCGHSHAYERSILLDRHYGLSATIKPPMMLNKESGVPAYRKPPGIVPHEGTVYVVAGASGFVFTDNETVTSPHPAMFTSFRKYGSVVLDVAGPQMEVKFLNITGGVDDSFAIQKGAPPEPTIIVATGEDVVGESSGTTYRTFGVPSINDSGAMAFQAKVKTPSGVVNAVLAGSPPVIVSSSGDGEFLQLSDPMLNNLGEVAFLGKTNYAEGLFSNRGGAMALVAQQGGEPPGVPGGVWKGITSAIFGDELIAFTASMKLGAGGVTSTTDSGLWISTPAGTALVLRERDQIADTVSSDLRQVRSFTALPTGAQTRGHGYLPGFDEVFARVDFADGARSVFGFSVRGMREIVKTGDRAPGAIFGPTFASIGVPFAADFGATFSGTINHLFNVVTTRNDAAIYILDSAGLARSFAKGDRAIGTATFDSFYGHAGSSARRVAVLAKAKGEGVSAQNDTGVWWRAGSEAPQLVAREGDGAPGAWNAASGKFAKFSSLALPGGENGAPIFIASLAGGAGGVGLWGLDSHDELVLLLRDGQSVTGKKVQSFTVLSAVARTAAQTRSFNNAGQVVARVIFADHSQAVVLIAVP